MEKLLTLLVSFAGNLWFILCFEPEFRKDSGLCFITGELPLLPNPHALLVMRYYSWPPKSGALTSTLRP